MSLQFLADYSSSDSHDAPIWTIATSSKVVWSASADGVIKAWDIESGKSLGLALASPHRNAVNSLSVSEEQGLLVSGSMDGSLALWSIEIFHNRQASMPKENEIGNVDHETEETEAHSSEVESASEDQKAAPAQQEQVSPTAYCESVARLQFANAEGRLGSFPIDSYVSDIHPKEPILATTGNTATVSLYRISAESGASCFLAPLRRFRADTVIRPRQSGNESASIARSSAASIGKGSKKGWGMCVRFSPVNGDVVAVGTDSGQVILHSTTTGDVLASFSNHAAAIRSVRFSLVPLGGSYGGAGLAAGQSSDKLDHLVISSDDRTLTIHDIRGIETRGSEISDQVVAMLQSHSGRVFDASVRQDGRIVASVSSDKSIKLWDLLASPKACVCTVGEDEKMWVLHWLGNARFVAAGDQGLVKWYRGAGAVNGSSDDL